MDNNKDVPATAERIDYDDPSHNRRQAPQLPPSSSFYLWLQAFIGPFLTIAITSMAVGLLYMWADFRLIRDGNLRTGAWQKEHTIQHRNAEQQHRIEDVAGASIQYQVGDCRSAIQSLEARVRKCEAAANEIKVWREFWNEKE